MNELFDEHGHLTDHAFRQLILEEADELDRLEIAEHLDFCDHCVERYTAQLCEQPLLEPQESLREGIMRRIRRRAGMIFFNKYVVAVAAACFAIIIWISGIFTMEVPQDQRFLQGMVEGTTTFAQKTTEFTNNLAKQITDFFNGMQIKGANDNEKK